MGGAGGGMGGGAAFAAAIADAADGEHSDFEDVTTPCKECGNEEEGMRFHLFCPKCGAKQ